MSQSDDAYRVERDTMGDVRVPRGAYWGAQTQRAVENFPISERRLTHGLVRALGIIKQAAAEVSAELGLLDGEIAGAIRAAAQEVIDGRLEDQFVVDIFQTGSGTSSNMNCNEVIANRATELLGGEIGSKRVHPNDHVNLGQSSNDVIPTAIHLAALGGIENALLPALEELHIALRTKAEEQENAVKIGRTHLQDATPVRFGQEMSGYARQVELAIRRVDGSRESLAELALGGTAVGTGLNAHPEFASRVIERINAMAKLDCREAKDHFAAQGAQDALVEASGALKTTSVSLMKIANDLRWLGSGPRCGLGELLLPAVQPGSSIMPGKVNPVICESVIQVAAQVIGNDLVVTLGGQWGNLELNTMMPVMASNLLESIEILAAAANLARRCIADLQIDAARAAAAIEQSMAMVTALVPALGYDKAAAIAKTAHDTGRTIREVACEVVQEDGALTEEKLDRLLDPVRMTGSR